MAGGDPLGAGPSELAELASSVWCSMNPETPGSWKSGKEPDRDRFSSQPVGEWLSCAESRRVWMELLEFVHAQKIF